MPIDTGKSGQAAGMNDLNAAVMPLQQGLNGNVDKYLSSLGIDKKNVTGAMSQVAGTQNLSAQTRYDDQGRPIRNDYLSIVGQDGRINPAYSMAGTIGNDVTMNQDGYNAIKDRALSQGPSTWANLAMQKQQADQANQLDAVNSNALHSQNQAYDSLASRGGLSAGQRLQLARQGERDAMSSSQGVNNAGAQARLGIQQQDEQTKNQMLSQLPGIDQANASFAQGQRAFGAQAKSADVGNALKDLQGYNAYNADAYSKAMQGWGAEKQANAQANMGGGGKK